MLHRIHAAIRRKAGRHGTKIFCEREVARMKKAYVCLGSNMGNSEEYLSMARRALGEIPGVLCARISSLYRTEPQGRKDQPWFLNQVVMLLCEDMDPEFLLEEMLAAETRIGRTRDAGDRFGPRVIDMDLLLFLNR